MYTFLFIAGWLVFLAGAAGGLNALATTGLSVEGAIVAGSAIISGFVGMAGGVIAEAIASKK